MVNSVSSKGHIIVAFDKKWTKIFGDPMTFKATVDRFGKLHLTSTKSMYDVTGIKPMTKVKS